MRLERERESVTHWIRDTLKVSADRSLTEQEELVDN